MLTLLLVAFVIALLIERQALVVRLNRAEDQRRECSCKHYGEDYHPADLAREGEW